MSFGLQRETFLRFKVILTNFGDLWSAVFESRAGNERRNFFYDFSDELNGSMSETMKVGAFADRQEILDDLIMPDAPFSSLLAPRHQSPSQNSNIQVRVSVVLKCIFTVLFQV